MTAGHGPEEIELRATTDLVCRRCDGPGLLAARFRRQWTGERGQTVDGFSEALLCPACDKADPAAAELIALFAVDGQLDQENLLLFTDLAASWVAFVRTRQASQSR